MKKLLSALSALCLSAAIAIPVTIGAAVPPEREELPEEKLPEYFEEIKENDRIKYLVESIISQGNYTDANINFSFGTPVEISLYYSEINAVQSPRSQWGLPFKIDGKPAGLIYFCSLDDVTEDYPLKFQTYFTFLNNAEFLNLENPDTEMALFIPDSTGIYGIKKDGGYAPLYNADYYSNNYSYPEVTYEAIATSDNILTIDSFKTNNDYIYKNTIDVTLGAGVEEPTPF